MEQHDLVVVGGGINGAGIARDAAGRGWSTLLVEAGDLGGATSSASTGLIHGGLRYLEQLRLRLVAESLAERATLLRIAPHLVRPIRFVMPHEPHLRPAWLIRLGLFLYDRIGGRGALPRSEAFRLPGSPYADGLAAGHDVAFCYHDARVDDARLVLMNVCAAAQAGASVRTRTRLVGASREAAGWRLTLQASPGGRCVEVAARVLVNAAGPWVQEVLETVLGLEPRGALRLVRGSHIVVPRVHAGDHACILQHPDRRVIFLLPWESRTCIGTTDVPVASPGDARISPAEIAYLCAAASRYTARAVTPEQVCHAWSGVRPLFDDGRGDPARVTRDYHLALDEAGAPVVSVYGGKLTTYRRLAERVLDRLAPWIGRRPCWTAGRCLPGGDFGDASFDVLLARLRAAHPRLDPEWLSGLLSRHGTRAEAVLGGAAVPADLGIDFGGGLHEREVRWFVRHEWAADPEDVLWRRTRSGAHLSAAERDRFSGWFGDALDRAARRMPRASARG